MWGRDLLKGSGLTQCPGATQWLKPDLAEHLCCPLSLDVPQGFHHSFNVPESLASKSLLRDSIRLDCRPETIRCHFSTMVLYVSAQKRIWLEAQ